jgi:photosystem II stability/assembly factor-like uncharacterized protein
MLNIRITALALTAAFCAPAETTLLSTTPITGGLAAGFAVDQAGSRYIAVYLQDGRALTVIQLLPGDRATDGIAVRKINLDGTIAYTAWLNGITNPQLGLPKIAVNAAGELYLAGQSSSRYLLATSGAIDQRNGSQYGFVVRLSAAGDRILAAAILDGFLGGTAVNSLALDSQENIYLAVADAYLDATPGTFTPEGPAGGGNFVIKLNSTASQILFISHATEVSDTLADFTVDREGNLYVAGLAATVRTSAPFLRERVSIDSGATWNLISESSSYSDLDSRSGRIAIHPTDPSALFAPGKGAIFRSTDRGANWIKMGAGLESVSIRQLSIHPTTPNLMFALAVQTADTPSVFRSEDSGATWSPVSSESLISRIVFDPSDANYVFLDNPFYLIRSTDAGQTFDHVNTTILNTLSHENASSLTVDPTSPGKMYGFTRLGLARSDDHGSTWRALYFLGCRICPIAPVFVDSQNPSTLYAVSFTNNGVGSGLAMSTDGGANWTLTSNQPQLSAASVRQSPSKPSVFFANIGGRVMRTADAGANWSAASGLGERMLPFSFEIAPSDDGVVYATYQRGSDLFVTKFDASASQALFTSVAGGFGQETVARIRVDAAGRIYVAGGTNSLDFPADSTVPDNDMHDGFVIAFDPNSGPDPIYSQRIGGAGTTATADAAVDCSGNLVLAANSTTPDLATTTSALQSTNAGGNDVVLAQFGVDGSLNYLSYFGGAKDDFAVSVAIDLDGKIHLAGLTGSTDLPGLTDIPVGQTMFVSTFGTSLASCR